MTRTEGPDLSVRQMTLGVAANAAAAVVASAAGLGIVLLAGRSMSPAEYASFASVWGLVFGGAAILAALEQENARVHSVTPGPIDRSQVEVAGIVAVGAAVVMAIVVTVFFEPLHLSSVPVALLVVASAAVFPALFTARGFLAGSLRFVSLSAVTVSEAVLRLVVVGAGLLAGLAALPVFAVAAVLGGCVGVPVLARHVSWRGARLDVASSIRRTTTLMAGNAMSAALVTGAPVLVTLAMVGTPAAEVGAVQAAVVVSRFPLIGLMLLQNLLVPIFTRRSSLYVDRDYARVASLLVVAVPSLAALSYVGAVPLLTLLYGAEYAVSATEIALLTTGATALGCIQVLVALAVSGDRHRLAPIAFAPTLLVTVVLMFVPWLAADLRVATALAAGPLVGLVVALAATSRWRRQGDVRTPPRA